MENKTGRPANGPEVVTELEGTDEAKRRAQVVLEVVAGNKSVGEACEELGISEGRFYRVREESLQGLVKALEPKPLGRPPAEKPAVDEEKQKLKEENERLKMELVASHLREELSVAMPHLLLKNQKKEKKVKKKRK